jgi:hypothetical protein
LIRLTPNDDGREFVSARRGARRERRVGCVIPSNCRRRRRRYELEGEEEEEKRERERERNAPRGELTRPEEIFCLDSPNRLVGYAGRVEGTAWREDG